MNNWPSPGAEVEEEIQTYWPFLADMAVIGSIVMKVRWIIVHRQLHMNLMGIEYMRLMPRESIYLVNIKMILKMPLKIVHYVLYFRPYNQETNQYHIQGKIWETVDAGIFMLNDITYLCIVDYQSEFPYASW